MPTLRQIQANQRNAKKSTGPASVTGKAASSLNALKTGIHAQSLVLPSEKSADLLQLTAGYYHQFQPATPEARALVDDLIRCEWLLRRFDLAETQAWQYQNNDEYRDPEPFPLGKSVTVNPTSFTRLQYRIDATRRARDRALRALKQLAAENAVAPIPVTHSPQTTSPQIGFVPSPPETLAPPPQPPTQNPSANYPAPDTSS